MLKQGQPVTTSTNPSPQQPTNISDRRRHIIIKPVTWWNLPQKAWFLILTQVTANTFLASALVSEYYNNIYYQAYVNNILPTILPILGVAFGTTSATIAMTLYLQLQTAHSTEEKRHHRPRITHPRGHKRATKTPGPQTKPSSSEPINADQTTKLSTPKPSTTQEPANPVATGEKNQPDPSEKPANFNRQYQARKYQREYST